MAKISDSTIAVNARRQSVGGYRNPPTGKEIKTEELPKAVQKRLEKAEISQEQYEQMLLFAQNASWLAGHRKLKMNDEKLRNLVVSSTNSEVGRTDTAGLRQGGKMTEAILSKSRKPLKGKSMELTIKNKNKLKQNPNPTSFKNDFKLK